MDFNSLFAAVIGAAASAYLTRRYILTQHATCMTDLMRRSVMSSSKAISSVAMAAADLLADATKEDKHALVQKIIARANSEYGANLAQMPQAAVKSLMGADDVN